ncbi:MAG: hypothetical protein PVG39_20150 [Desulfobacteraceae bacterium]
MLKNYRVPVGGFTIMLFVMALFIMTQATAYAHSPLMLIEDNANGTITVTAGFSNGKMGTGKKIILKSASDGNVLWENTLNEEGELLCPKQAVPYIVYFDGGPGHSMEKEGIMLKAGEKAPVIPSSSGALKGKKPGPDAVTGATRPADIDSGKADKKGLAYPEWRLPLSADFTDDIKLNLLSESLSLKNSLGLIRKTSLMQCYQYHGQIKLASIINMVKNKRKAGKKVEFHARPVSMCMGVTSGYLAADFAIRELYGKEMPVMEDFRIETRAKMDGVWDAFELILGQRLSHDRADKGPSPEAFVFTAQRLSDGKKIVFTYSDDFRKRLAGFFKGKNNPDLVPEKEFQAIRSDILKELITRHGCGDSGYFVTIEDNRDKTDTAAMDKQPGKPGPRIPKKGRNKPPILSEWNMPMPIILGNRQLHDKLESINITTKNSFGMVRKFNIIQCNQFHTRPSLERLLAEARKKKEQDKNLSKENKKDGAMCLGMVSGYLASHYAIHKMYGDEIPDIKDFTLGSNCPMAGLWDSLNLVCAKNLKRDDPSTAPSKGAFSFTITRASDGRAITFTFTKEYQNKFERFFDMKWNPKKYKDAKSKIKQLQEEMEKSILKRFAEGDYGYFRVL